LNIRREVITPDNPWNEDEMITAISMCYLVARQRIRLVKLAAEKGGETKSELPTQKPIVNVKPKHHQPN
jgi:hypothetical protein